MISIFLTDEWKCCSGISQNMYFTDILKAIQESTVTYYCKKKNGNLNIILKNKMERIYVDKIVLFS